MTLYWSALGHVTVTFHKSSLINSKQNHSKLWSLLWFDARFVSFGTFFSSGPSFSLSKACQLTSMLHEHALIGFSSQFMYLCPENYMFVVLGFQSKPALAFSLTVHPTIPLAISFLFSLFGQWFQVCPYILSYISHFFAFLLLKLAPPGFSPQIFSYFFTCSLAQCISLGILLLHMIKLFIKFMYHTPLSYCPFSLVPSSQSWSSECPALTSVASCSVSLGTWL